MGIYEIFCDEAGEREQKKGVIEQSSIIARVVADLDVFVNAALVAIEQVDADRHFAGVIRLLLAVRPLLALLFLREPPLERGGLRLRLGDGGGRFRRGHLDGLAVVVDAL